MLFPNLVEPTKQPRLPLQPLVELQDAILRLTSLRRPL